MSEVLSSVGGPSLESSSEILKILSDILDPELQVPMITVGLLRFSKSGKILEIFYKPPSIFTPPGLAIAGALQIYKRLFEAGVCSGFRVRVEHYYLAEEINIRLEDLEDLMGEIYCSGSKDLKKTLKEDLDTHQVQEQEHDQDFIDVVIDRAESWAGREIFYKVKIGGLVRIVEETKEPLIVLSAGLRIVEEISGYIHECLERNPAYDYMHWEWNTLKRIRKDERLYSIYSEILDALFSYELGLESDLEGLKQKIIELAKFYGLIPQAPPRSS